MTAAERRRRARMREVAELRQKGFAMDAIAAHLGVSKNTIWHDLQRWEAFEIERLLFEINRENRTEEGRGHHEGAD